jgi:hypothetical protein
VVAVVRVKPLPGLAVLVGVVLAMRGFRVAVHPEPLTLVVVVVGRVPLVVLAGQVLSYSRCQRRQRQLFLPV